MASKSRIVAQVLPTNPNDKGVWYQLDNGRRGFIPYGNILGIYPETEETNSND